MALAAIGVDFAKLDGWQALLAVLIIGLIFGGIVGGTLYAAIRAADYPPPIAIVVVLAAITLALIATYLVTRDQELLTLAGMGLGALAGAVAAVWGPGHSRFDNKRDDDKDEQ